MKEKTIIEIFSAGCTLCDDVVKDVQEKYAESSEVKVLDMHDAVIAHRAKEIGITAVPSIVIDGKLADCCSGRGIELGSLPTANTTKGSCCCD